MKKKIIFFILLAFITFSCNKSENKTDILSFKMGFSNLPPKPDINIAIQSINIWIPRADAAILSSEVPWKALFTGTTPDNILLPIIKI